MLIALTERDVDPWTALYLLGSRPILCLLQFKGLGGPCVAAHQGADIRMSGAGLGPGSAGVLATGSGTTVQASFLVAPLLEPSLCAFDSHCRPHVALESQAEDVSFQTCSTGLCISSGAYAQVSTRDKGMGRVDIAGAVTCLRSRCSFLRLQVTRCTFEDQVGPCVSASGVGTRAELAGAVVSGETRGLFGWASVAFSAENGATVWAKKGCVFRGRTRATHGGKVILPLR